MIAKPEPEIIEGIIEDTIEGMIREMSLEKMRQIVWDMLYEDLICQKWSDLVMQAEEFAPETLEDLSP